MKLLSERFPNGATSTTRQRLHNEVLARARASKNWMQLSEEDRILDIEDSAVDMIESLFAYHYDVRERCLVNSHSNGMGGYLDNAPGYIDSYAKDIAKSTTMTFEDAKAELIKVFENQMKLLSNAIIHNNVHEDSEGCTYNSIEYREAN